MTTGSLFSVSRLVAAALCLVAAGCAVLPAGGPTSSELLGDSKEEAAKVGYLVFDLTTDIARVVGPYGGESFHARFGGRGPRVMPVVGVGDILSVAVFESSLGGLFTPPETSTGATAKNVTLPAVTVDNRGYIRIPFAGEVLAAGRTVSQIERAIEEQLKGRAIDPQVLVTLGTNRSAMVTVSGDAKNPNRFPVGTANERILDMISQAGGVTGAVHETEVTLVRGDRRGTANLKAIFDNPNENVYVRPGDTVLLVRKSRAVIALGASGRNAEIRFENAQMTLSSAIAQAGGLLDSRADPTGVFVFRFEPVETIRRIQPGYRDPQGRQQIPTIYKLDLKSAEGYFVSQTFQMRNQDQVFVANADGAQLLKFLQLIGVTVGAGSSAATAASRF